MPGPVRDPRHARGRLGELVALVLLMFKGYRPRHRNWRCPAGELDLVMARSSTVVFVEVKTRSTADFGGAEAAVSAGVRRRMARAAAMYLSRFDLWESACRFDVVLVERGPSRFGWRVRHLRDAFQPDFGRMF